MLWFNKLDLGGMVSLVCCLVSLCIRVRTSFVKKLATAPLRCRPAGTAVSPVLEAQLS